MIYHFLKPLYSLLSMVKTGIGGVIYSSNRFITAVDKPLVIVKREKAIPYKKILKYIVQSEKIIKFYILFFIIFFVTVFTSAQNPYSLSFDGANDYVDVTGLTTDLSGSGDFTIEAWVKADGNTETYGITQSHIASYSSDFIFFYQSNGTTLFWMRSVTLDEPAGFEPTKWNHIAMVWDKSAATYEGFVNGESIGTSGVVTGYGGINSVKIGTRGDATSSFFGGIMDEVRIWDAALTQAQIQARMFTPKITNSDPLWSNLIGYWKLDKGSGTTAADSSQNSNNGTLHEGAGVGNGPTWRQNLPFAVWQGNTDSDWNTNSNWSSSLVPTSDSCENTIIESVANDPVISADATSVNLIIKSGADLTHNAGIQITLDGNYFNDGTHNAGDDNIILNATVSGNTIEGTGTINNVASLQINDFDHIVSSGTNLTINTTATGSVDIANDITVTNNGIISILGNLDGGNAASTWVNEANSTLKVGGVLLSTGTLTASASGNTVHYIGTAAQNIKTLSASAYHNLEFTGASTKTQQADLIANGNVIINSGTLDCGNFNLSVKGNWSNSGAFTQGTGTVTFNGSCAQSITNTADETFYGMTVNKSSETLTLVNNVDVTNTLTMTNGNIDAATNSKILTLGDNVPTQGTLNYTSGTIIGEFQRWLTTAASNILFPTGISASYRAATINFSNLTNGSLIVEFVAIDPGGNGLPLNDAGFSIIHQFTEGYWNFTAANGLASNDYDLELTGTDFTSYTIDIATRIIKRTNGGAWFLDGTHSNASPPTCYRNTLTAGISTLSTQFGLGVGSCNRISTQTGAWNVSSTWSGGIAPNPVDNATIANGDTVTITADETINLLTIDNGGVLTVNATKSLTVTGDLTINGGLILNSDASGTATLIDNGTINGSGTVTAQRYLSGAVYHYVSAPINSANTGLFSSAHRFYLWDEPTSSDDTVAAWQTPPSGNLTVMKGYAAKFLGNTTVNYTGAAAELNTKTYSITVTNTDGTMPADKEGWNMVGNPYPSAVDWDAGAGWTKTNVEDGIYFFKGSDFNYASYVLGSGTNGGTQYIPAMQGFFVKCDNIGGSGTLGMTNPVRIINSQAYWKNNKSEQNNILKLKAERNGYSDETVVRFNAFATNEFDSDYDAYKLLSSYENVPQIYTKLLNGTILSINTLAPLTENLSMPLIFRAGVTGEYTLNVVDINFDPSISVLLEDTQEDVFMDLQTTPNYTFNISTGTWTNRFIIHFSLTTGINDYSEDNNLSPYIYSWQNNIYVVFNTSKSIKGKIIVYDILGREIIKKDITKLNKLNINSVKGLYIVKVLTDNNVYTKKIILNK